MFLNMCPWDEKPFLAHQRESRFKTLFVSRNVRVRGEVGKKEFSYPGCVSFTSSFSMQGDVAETTG